MATPTFLRTLVLVAVSAECSLGISPSGGFHGDEVGNGVWTVSLVMEMEVVSVSWGLCCNEKTIKNHEKNRFLFAWYLRDLSRVRVRRSPGVEGVWGNRNWSAGASNLARILPPV